MQARCLICKAEFLVPEEIHARRALLVCPDCGFIGLWDQDRLSVPTYEEEAALERVHGHSIAGNARIASEVDETIVDDFDPELPLPYKRKLFVKFLVGSNKGNLQPLASGHTVLGRRDADINIEDAKASRKHAVIEAISRENIFLRDLASTNGTYLNGVRVRSKKLRNGDVIRIGSSELQFLWQDED